jgi:hypothetical protein
MDYWHRASGGDVQTVQQAVDATRTKSGTAMVLAGLSYALGPDFMGDATGMGQDLLNLRDRLRQAHGTSGAVDDDSELESFDDEGALRASIANVKRIQSLLGVRGTEETLEAFDALQAFLLNSRASIGNTLMTIEVARR